MHDIKCPNCNSYVLKSRLGEVKMRSKLLVWNEDGCFAVCKSCTSDVPLDVNIFKSIQKKMTFEIKTSLD